MPKEPYTDAEVEARLAAAANRRVGATDGWTPLEFYAYIIRTLGMPASFRFDGNEWVADAPFTKPVPESVLQLLEAQGV